MSGARTVFCFTFRQQLLAKGYRAITVLLAVLLFALPAVMMPLIEKGSMEEAGEIIEPTVSDTAGAEAADVCCVYFTAELQNEAWELSALETAKLPGYEQTDFVMTPDFETAVSAANGDSHSLVLLITEDDAAYTVRGSLPEHSELAESDAKALAWAMSAHFQELMLQSLSPLQAEAITTPIQIAAPSFHDAEENYDADENYDAEENETLGMLREILTYVATYINIMLIYFLVLFYGMSAANSVVMEKASKLMDTFLVSVRPRDMIAGKMLATFAAAVLQFLIWLAALVGGFALGTHLVKAINPDTTMGLIQIFTLAKGLGGLISVGGAITAVAIIFAGFLLYCALASIGGSLASKAEELSSTLTVFTLILIASFFAVLYGTGLFFGDNVNGIAWYDLIPFTSIMITPSRILLGSLSLWEGLLSLGIVLAVTVLLVLLAGRIYQMMSMYKGNPPKLKQLIRMMRS